jgi:hypothetical protein
MLADVLNCLVAMHLAGKPKFAARLWIKKLYVASGFGIHK